MRALVLLSALFLALPAPASAQEAADDRLLSCGYLCGEDGEPLMTAGDTPPDTGLVTRIFIGAFSEACSRGITGGPDWYGPEVYELTFRPDYAQPEEPDSDLRLYRYFCDAGAYNERHVYLTWTADWGVRPVSFAVPEVDTQYDGEGVNAAIKGMALTGMSAQHELVNSSFDAATRAITSWSCWRGLCDASSRGVWRLDADIFSLVTYDVDPTYDGEVNQFRVIDYGVPAPVDVSTPLPYEPPAFDEDED